MIGEKSMRKNKWIRGLLFFIALFVLLVEIGNGNVQASGKEGSLTIDYHGMTKNNMEIPLVNATFSLYQVGTYENGEYQLETSVQNSNFTTKKLNQLNNMIASKQEEQAKTLLRFLLENDIKGQVRQTGSDGKATFTNLEEGMYLVAQTEELGYEKGIFRSSPFFISIPFEEEGEKKYDVTVNTKNEWIPEEELTTIGLRDLTIYTGGNEESGELDGFPTPRYIGITQDTEFQVDGEIWNVKEKGYPFDVIYTFGEEESDLSVKDTKKYAKEDTKSGLYVAHIIPKKRGSVIKKRETPVEEFRKVSFEEAILTVRDVDNEESNKQVGVIVSEAEEKSGNIEYLTPVQQEELERGLGVALIPRGSKISVNGDDTLGIVGIDESALLFDPLLYYNIKNEETGNYILEDRAGANLKKQGISLENRKYESRYLDLVENEDGNLWLSSTKGSIIYWPYPEGTNKNTEFHLFHYRNLFREYGIKGHMGLREAIRIAPEEQIEVKNTDYGVRFFVPQGGFGPFVLSWRVDGGKEQERPDDEKTPEENTVQVEEKILEENTTQVEEQKTPEQEDKPNWIQVKTGDRVPLLLLTIAFFASFIGIIVSLYHKKKKK